MPKYYKWDHFKISSNPMLKTQGSNFIKVWDYHWDGYFYCKRKVPRWSSPLYKWEDYKYVMDVDNGRSKFSVWFNSSKKRWELFDGDTCDTPLRKKKVIGKMVKRKGIKLGKHMTIFPNI